MSMSGVNDNNSFGIVPLVATIGTVALATLFVLYKKCTRQPQEVAPVAEKTTVQEMEPEIGDDKEQSPVDAAAEKLAKLLVEVQQNEIFKQAAPVATPAFDLSAFDNDNATTTPKKKLPFGAVAAVGGTYSKYSR